MSANISFVDFGGNGDVIHLAHANGFPAQSYQKLVDELIPYYHVIGMNARPLWDNSPFSDFHSWREAADDLIRFLDEQHLKNVIGIGHSFGSICTVIAANKRPDLFKKLVLIEPVILPNWVYVVSAILPKFLMKKINPIVKKTLTRTESWKSRTAVFAHFRSKKVFEQLGDGSLWDYVNAVTDEAENGEARLNYSKEWEAQIFLTVINPWKNLKKLKHPFIAFRGETSDTITKEVWAHWKSVNRTGTLIEMKNAGHLVPLEEPKLLANEILRFLSDKN